jgi:hypothetical protein
MPLGRLSYFKMATKRVLDQETTPGSKLKIFSRIKISSPEPEIRPKIWAREGRNKSHDFAPGEVLDCYCLRQINDRVDEVLDCRAGFMDENIFGIHLALSSIF